VRPSHQIISMIKWTRTSKLSIKNSLTLRPSPCAQAVEALAEGGGSHVPSLFMSLALALPHSLALALTRSLPPSLFLCLSVSLSRSHSLSLSLSLPLPVSLSRRRRRWRRGRLTWPRECSRACPTLEERARFAICVVNFIARKVLI